MKPEMHRYISAKDTAAILRTVLKAAFPTVKFSVRTDRGSSVSVTWFDGPNAEKISGIVDDYDGEGFDGSCDLAFSHFHWLMPDKKSIYAGTPGTEGSRGSFPEVWHPKPHGAELVHFNASVSVTRYCGATLATRIMNAICIELNTTKTWDIEHTEWGFSVRGFQEVPKLGGAYISNVIDQVFRALDLTDGIEQDTIVKATKDVLRGVFNYYPEEQKIESVPASEEVASKFSVGDKVAGFGMADLLGAPYAEVIEVVTGAEVLARDYESQLVRMTYAQCYPLGWLLIMVPQEFAPGKTEGQRGVRVPIGSSEEAQLTRVIDVPQIAALPEVQEELAAIEPLAVRFAREIRSAGGDPDRLPYPYPSGIGFRAGHLIGSTCDIVAAVIGEWNAVAESFPNLIAPLNGYGDIEFYFDPFADNPAAYYAHIGNLMLTPTEHVTTTERKSLLGTEVYTTRSFGWDVEETVTIPATRDEPEDREQVKLGHFPSIWALAEHLVRRALDHQLGNASEAYAMRFENWFESEIQKLEAGK